MVAGAPIRVDPATLRDLADHIETIAGHLRSVKATFEGHGSALQSRSIEDALHDFNDAWSDKRDKLGEGLDSAVKALRNGADQFEQADCGLAAQATGTKKP